MTDIASNGNGQIAAGETQTGQELLGKALDTALVLTAKAAVTQSAAEAKDFAAGVLSMSQVIALLDPTRDTQGIPLEHHAAMEHMKGQRELEKVKEQAKAQAPAPKKKISVTGRDERGNATGYESEG